MATQMDNMMVRVAERQDVGRQGAAAAGGRGRHNERYGGTTGKNAVPRVQGYGFTSHAPKGVTGRHPDA